MVDLVFIAIVQNKSYYDRLLVEKVAVNRVAFPIKDITFYCTKYRKFFVDGNFAYCLIQELIRVSYYRQKFIDHVYPKTNAIKLILIPPKQEIIDYNWNYRITYLVRERCELEHILSWLSTLGGAFSALGDHFQDRAEIAGKISANQLLLALRLGDPSVVSRCRLYYSLSLIQRQYYALAKQIIKEEYVKAKGDNIIDIRLINMCKGIWCKLQYEHRIFVLKKCDRK